MADQKKRLNSIKIKGGRLIFKNFQGKENPPYNKAGERNFGVLLDDDLAKELENDGWRVKYRPPREEDGYQQPWLSVKVKYDKYPPIIYLVNSQGKIKLEEDTVGQLDWTRIKFADLTINPYSYPAILDRKGNEVIPAGVSAYLKTLFATIIEDDLFADYADIPDISNPSQNQVDGIKEPPFD